MAFARAIPRSSSPTSPILDWEWGLGVTAIPFLSPLTEEHHLAVLLFPLALLLLTDSEEERFSADMLVLLAGVILLGSRYSLERFPAFHHGLLSLFGTGKLFGVAGLAWILLRRTRESLPAPPSAPAPSNTSGSL